MVSHDFIFPLHSFPVGYGTNCFELVRLGGEIEKMIKLDELKKRLEELNKDHNKVIAGEHDVCCDFYEFCPDIISLCEAYREVASKDGHVCHDKSCQPTCRELPGIDREADVLYSEKRGEK